MIRGLVKLAILLVLVALIALGWMGWRHLQRPNTLPFRHVRLEQPTEHLTSAMIRQLVWSHLDGGFFSLKVEPLKEAFSHEPWIESVSIRREWPDTLLLTIVERQGVARWGKQGVVSASGDIFYPRIDSTSSKLPTLNVPKSSIKTVLNDFDQFKERLDAINLKIVSLTLNSDTHEYELYLSGGIQMSLGRENVLPKLSDFIRLYPKVVKERSNQIEHVDLRYANGFAIKWKHNV